ncbi:MAG: hypothetical protein U0361_07280 [Nitrospiraceae bacterium]
MRVGSDPQDRFLLECPLILVHDGPNRTVFPLGTVMGELENVRGLMFDPAVRHPPLLRMRSRMSALCWKRQGTAVRSLTN